MSTRAATTASQTLALRASKAQTVQQANYHGGKALTLGSEGGGLGHAEGAGFGGKTGKQRRDQRSKSRDRRKKDYRQERKDKGKR